MYGRTSLQEDFLWKTLLGITLLFIGIILLFLGIAMYILKNMPSNIAGNGTTIVIIPPFVIIQGGFDISLLLLLIALALIIPIVMIYLFLRSIRIRVS